jgi:hypothetical protein
MKIASLVVVGLVAAASAGSARAQGLPQSYSEFSASAGTAKKAQRLRSQRDEFVRQFEGELASEAGIVADYGLERDGGTISAIRADLELVDRYLTRFGADAAKLELGERRLKDAQDLYANQLVPLIKEYKDFERRSHRWGPKF